MSKKLLIGFFLLAFTGVWAQVESVLPQRPVPPVLYNDLTKARDFLTPAQAEQLERMLVAYDDSTGTQICVVVVETLSNYTANEFATALGRSWGVGSKAFNNGVVILIATGANERDAYIATGYGMEGSVPDVVAKSIVENDIIFNFKQGQYYQGLQQAVQSIVKAAAGEYKVSSRRKKRGESEIDPIVIIIALIVLSLLFRGGGRGGSHRGWTGGTWIGGGGFGGGGFGGGFGGGSSGGFGGFGGGSFGGGGAGGKW